MKKEYVFSCSGDLEDLEYLRQLFIINGVDSKMEKFPMHNGQMGMEEVLIALISGPIIPSVLAAVSILLQNRKKEIKIFDKKNKKEIHLISQNGQGFSDLEMEKIYSFFKD